MPEGGCCRKFVKEKVDLISRRGIGVLKGLFMSSEFFLVSHKNKCLDFTQVKKYLYHQKTNKQKNTQLELQPCFHHSWSASYIVPFVASGSFRVKAFFFQVISLVCLSQLSPAADCWENTYRIINDAPRVRKAEQEKLAQKGHHMLLSPSNVPQLRAPPEVLEADASRIARQGVKRQKDCRA